MKKVFSSILFACFAMVGLLSSCVEEQIETTFEVGEAQAVITFQVVNLATGEFVTNAAKVTASAGVIAGNTVTITGNKNIVAQGVVITASYTSANGNVYTDSKTVMVNALRAGGRASYTVTLVVGEATPIDGYTITTVLKENPVLTDIRYFDKATFEYAGKFWAKNESQYLIKGDVNYKLKFGTEVFSFYGASGWEGIVEQMAEGIEAADPLTYTEGVLPIVASAWSLYTVWQTTVCEETEILIYATDRMGYKTEIGQIGVWHYNSSIEQDERAIPGHEAHYTPGHGHDDHGHGSENAGGGIVYGD